MDLKREFFPKVKKTIMPRPHFAEEFDVLGLSGTAWAINAAIYGDNWYLDREESLIEIYGAGAAISFRHLLPNKTKYEKEGLYLRLKLAYRTTASANVNIRNFSGSHVTLANNVEGAIYDDLNTYWWVTDDMTININSIYTDEKLWLQRVDWEWVSKDVVYEDEVDDKNIFLTRSFKDVEKLYTPQKITKDTVKEYLIQRIQNDDHFAKRCLTLLCQDQLINKDFVELYAQSGIKNE